LGEKLCELVPLKNPQLGELMMKMRIVNDHGYDDVVEFYEDLWLVQHYPDTEIEVGFARWILDRVDEVSVLEYKNPGLGWKLVSSHQTYLPQELGWKDIHVMYDCGEDVNNPELETFVHEYRVSFPYYPPVERLELVNRIPRVWRGGDYLVIRLPPSIWTNMGDWLEEHRDMIISWWGGKSIPLTEFDKWLKSPHGNLKLVK
jgi:hypothetical protein